MKLIEEMSNLIEEEMEDAEKYAQMALLYKENDRALAEMYYNLSMDETKHSNIIHTHAVRIIEEYKNTGNEAPASMVAVYDYLHKKHIEKANKIKVAQNSFRE